MKLRSVLIPIGSVWIGLMAAHAANAGVVISDSAPYAAGTSLGTYDYFGAPNNTVAPGYYATPTLGEVFTAPISGTLTSFTLYLYGSTGSVEGGLSDWTPTTSTWSYSQGPNTIGPLAGSSAYGGSYGGTSGAPLYESSAITSPATVPGGPLYTPSFDTDPLTAYTFSPDVAVTAGQTYVAYLTVIDGSSSTFQSGATTFVQMAAGAAPSADAQNAAIPPTPLGADYAVWNNVGYCNPSCNGPGPSYPLLVNPDLDPNNNPNWLQPDFLTNADFTATIGVVPEPATWAMLVLGIGGIGGMMRYSRGKRPIALV